MNEYTDQSGRVLVGQPASDPAPRAHLFDLSRRSAIALLAIFLLALIVRIVPVLYPLEVIDSQSLVDDTYLSLEIAQNIGAGDGPRYKDNYTSGYQPLYLLLAAPLFSDFDAQQASVAALDEKVRQSLLINIGFDLGALLLLALMLARQLGWRAPTFVGLLLWTLHPMVIKTALNGMETSVATFFLLLVLYLFQTRMRRATQPLTRFGWGVVLGAAVLARIDLAVLGFWILVIELNDVRLQRWSFQRAAAALLLTFIGFLVAYLPWLLWSHAYTGDWFPVSGSGVRFQSLIAMEGHETGQPILWSLASLAATILVPIIKSPLLWLTAIVLSILAWRQRRNPQHWLFGVFAYFEPWALLLLFAATLIPAYGLYIMGWWFYDRYLFCLNLLPLLLIAFACDAYMNRAQPNGKAKHWRAQYWIMGAVLLCVVQPRLWTLELGVADESNQGYRSVGIWLNERLPEGSTVGAMQTGGLGFYGNRLRVVNLDGVVNRPALEALKESRIEDYIIAEQVEYVVGWPINMKAMARTSQWGEDLLARMTLIDQSAFETWSWSRWDLYRVDFLN